MGLPQASNGWVKNFMERPIYKWMITGGTPLLGNHHLVHVRRMGIEISDHFLLLELGFWVCTEGAFQPKIRRQGVLNIMWSAIPFSTLVGADFNTDLQCLATLRVFSMANPVAVPRWNLFSRLFSSLVLLKGTFMGKYASLFCVFFLFPGIMGVFIKWSLHSISRSWDFFATTKSLIDVHHCSNFTNMNISRVLGSQTKPEINCFLVVSQVLVQLIWNRWMFAQFQT